MYLAYLDTMEFKEREKLLMKLRENNYGSNLLILVKEQFLFFENISLNKFYDINSDYFLQIFLDFFDMTTNQFKSFKNKFFTNEKFISYLDRDYM